MKRIIFLLLLFVLNVNAQVTQEWVARFGGPNNAITNYPSAIGVDNQGNIYVTGNTLFEGYWDIATVKYNPDGIEQWVRIYDGPANQHDQAWAMVADENGNVYVTGKSVGFSGMEDIVTIKYSPNGQELWVNRYNRTGQFNEQPGAIALDSEGNVYVAGRSGGLNGSDYVTVKYNSLGAQQWVRFYNGPANSSDGATALTIDSEGNIYVTGSSRGIGTEEDFATVKYNSNGVEQWVQRYNGPANGVDIAWAITADNNGNVYVTGQSRVTSNNIDFTTVKYDSNGVQKWVRIYNSPINGNDIPSSIAVDNSGNIYVAGYNGLNFITVKYNSTGQLQWDQIYANPGENLYLRKMAIDDQDNIYVTGSSENLDGANYLTIKYDTDGNQKWLQTYQNNNLFPYDLALAIAIDNQQNVFVTGLSSDAILGREDYATIKYSQEDEKQPPANLAYNEDRHSLTWTKSPSSGVQNYLIVKQSYDSGTNTFSEWISVEDSGGVVPASDEDWVIRTSGFYNYKVGAVFSNDTLFTDSISVLRGYVLRRKEGDVVTAYNHNVNSFKLIENDSSYMWPYSWYQQFSYLTKPSSVFHDWPLHTEIVGSGNPKQYYFWYNYARQWKGSCYGFAAYSLLNFNKNASFYQQFPLAENVIPGEASITAPLRKIINHLMSTQVFNSPTRLSNEPTSIQPDTAIFILSKLLDEFSTYEANNFDRTLSLLGIKDENNKTINHAILPVAIEKLNFQSPVYTVWVYDSNSPATLMNLNINTITNTWSYPALSLINKTGGIILNGPVSSRLGTLNFDFIKEIFDSFKQGGENYTDSVGIRRNILVSPHSSVSVSIDGETIAGYDLINNDLVSYENSIVAASDGYLRAPFGYELPLVQTRVTFSDQIEGSSAGVMFQTESGNYYFAERTDSAGISETEIIDIKEEGLSYLNNDNTNKTVSLVSFYTENDFTKLANVNSLSINQNEVIDLSFVADQLILKNIGTAKTYNITLTTEDNNSQLESIFELIALAENTTHFIQPDWNNIDSSSLTILIDLGNDGTIDDTLTLVNQVTGIQNDQGSLMAPDTYNLAQNYPNPFNPSTKISWQLPVGSHQTLKIYDMLGNEVATLVNEYREAGRYEVTFDGSNLASGMYLYRLQAGSFVETKKMILIK
jgi:uncharacterized delta-60 repeat protein